MPVRSAALRFRLVMGLHANRCGLDSRWDDDRVNRSSEQLFWLLSNGSSDWARTSNHPINSLNFTHAEQHYIGIVHSVCAMVRMSCIAGLQVVGQLLDTPSSAFGLAEYGGAG